MGHESRLLSELTDKQRDALNLLIQHKTSKEMSRILGVSPHTVDQRIESAKRKFAVTTRGELAQAYKSSLPLGERLTYQNSHIASTSDSAKTSISEEASVRARGVISGVGDGVFLGGACPTQECGIAGGHRAHRYGGVCTLQP